MTETTAPAQPVTFVLPTWRDCRDASEDEDCSALERFVWAEEPAFPQDGPWRELMSAAISEVIADRDEEITRWKAAYETAQDKYEALLLRLDATDA